MSPALTAAKLRHQQELERNYPATLTIGGVNYKGCIATHTGHLMTLEGGTKQERSATFQVRQATLPLSLLRDTAIASQPLKRIPITHVETGIIYRLDEEYTDTNGVTRTLTCIHPEH